MCMNPIGHLHDDIILLLRPESFRVLLFCANYGFCYPNLTGITKFKYERKNEKDFVRISKITPSCKWPIASKFEHGFLKHVIRMLSNIDRRLNLGFRLPAGAL